MLNANGIQYYDNHLNVNPGSSFETRIKIGSGATSNSRLWVEGTWITVRGIVSGEPVPEFESAWIVLAAVLLVPLFVMSRLGVKHRNP